ncbi:MAG: zinc ribbon domain-containing protein [Chloroflexia bacterium]
MPIYEYYCQQCKSPFEKLRPLNSNDNEISCPKCGSKVRRMLSVVAAISKTSEGSQSYSGSGGCGCGGNCGCGNSHN